MVLKRNQTISVLGRGPARPAGEPDRVMPSHRAQCPLRATPAGFPCPCAARSGRGCEQATLHLAFAAPRVCCSDSGPLARVVELESLSLAASLQLAWSAPLIDTGPDVQLTARGVQSPVRPLLAQKLSGEGLRLTAKRRRSGKAALRMRARRPGTARRACVPALSANCCRNRLCWSDAESVAVATRSLQPTSTCYQWVAESFLRRDLRG